MPSAFIPSIENIREQRCGSRCGFEASTASRNNFLVSRPMGRGNVVVATMARVQRLEPAATPGWYGVAALFDDMAFDRDDRVPSRFLKP